MVSIVVPTYNERENITNIIGGIAQALRRVDHEIIVVDDRSPDGTAQVVEKLAGKDRRIRLLSRPPPRDLGKSILMGVQSARGDVIIGMDGDGNHDPRYIPYLLEVLQNADLAVGSRFVHPREIGLRYWGSFLFNAMLKYFFGFPIWDNTSGFYATRKKTLLSLGHPAIYYGYGEYHLRLVYKAMQRRLRIVELPVIYPPRLHGQSKSRALIMLGTYLATAVRLWLGL